MTPRLKSLEMHGYKTFASRTDFEFPGVITAIVGPNGSGKSNIADALRWVLGEQSYSLLRGRKTEDMIFAGSEQRPRAGMASATITFDNSDGWLPIDYSEVAITRRAYRDGQNEYLLNGQRVRLKEISELLAQSGLAERTYTIIGQGLVDAALSLKPEERRSFFEEAAGIGLYRSRKEESINRLDNTRRNLERVHDIITELEPRLNSLEKQAKRALEYERVKADLRVLLREWYGYYWNHMLEEVAHSQEMARVQETRQQQAREKLNDVETRLDKKRQEVIEQRNQLNLWHAEAAEKHREREKINTDLAVLDERQRAITAQLQMLGVDASRLEDEQTERELRLGGLNQEIARLSAELEDSRVQAEQAQRLVTERRGEREKIEREVQLERRRLVEFETRIVQLKAKRDELVNRRETIVAAQKDLVAALVKAESGKQAVQTRFEQAFSQRQLLEASVKESELKISARRKSIHDKETERKTIVDLLGNLRADLSRAQAQLEVLNQAERSATGLNKGAKFVLDTFRSGKLAGKFQAFSTMLEVPPEYEVAVAAILGEFIDGIVYDETSSPEQVFRLLEEGEKGRAVMFPKALRGLEKRPRVDDPECLGSAAELVRVPDEYQELVKQLLGDTLVVKDRNAARRLSELIDARSRVVTLKGEVFWGSGVISAGQEGRSGVIARSRQKKELEIGIERLKEDVSANETRLGEADRKLSTFQVTLRDEEQAFRQESHELNRAVQEYQQASLAVEQSRQRLEWSRSQKIEADDRLKKTMAEVEQVDLDIKRFEEETQVQNEKIRTKNRMLAELPLEDLLRQAAHWETNTAVSARAFKELDRRVEEQQKIFQAGKGQIEASKARTQALLSQQSASEGEINALHARETSLNSIIEQLQQKITPTEAALAELEADYSQLQGDHLVAQQATTLADRLNTQAQLDLSRNRESLNTLRRRIEDDFGLVAFDYNAEVGGQSPLPFEGMVEQLPVVKQLPQDFEENINRQRSLLRRIGAINPEAQQEFKEVKERYEFLKNQVEDLKKADADLRLVIADLDELMQREFLKTFEAVAAEFHQNFTRLFGGGSAHLVLMDEEHPAEGGVDIEARLPGRREQGLSLLSGGERSLTAVALIFSLLKVSPTPFCVMDEVDAMLDEANVGRFRDLLQELSRDTQFIIITHNRNTVQAADVIYGVTMGRDSASQIISLKLDEVGEDLVK